jgi:hypothetical protein
VPAGPSADPLAPLLDLPGVRVAADGARAAVDRTHRHPANRRGWPAVAAEASMRAARASAALDGGDVRLPAVRSPAAGQAAFDPILAGAVRVADAIGTLLATWRRAPLQALARLHVLAAADLVNPADGGGALGRPRAEHAVSTRLHLLAGTVTRSTALPGMLLAAVVHGELLALEPFGTADGVVARAASRLTAIATGLDPKGLAVPEVGHLRRATEYHRAAVGFATGEPDALAIWLVHCCQAWQDGAREACSIADAAGPVYGAGSAYGEDVTSPQ